MFGSYYDQLDLSTVGIAIGNSSVGGKNGKGKDGEAVPFDVNRLPLAYGPKTTENLIEAIFNPVATSEKKKESPFTYYVPPEEKGKGKAKTIGSGVAVAVGTGGGLAVYDNATTRRQGQADALSVCSTGSSSEDTYASAHTASTSETGRSWRSRSTYNLNEDVGGGRVKGWWKKIGRPMTPTAVR